MSLDLQTCPLAGPRGRFSLAGLRAAGRCLRRPCGGSADAKVPGSLLPALLGRTHAASLPWPAQAPQEVLPLPSTPRLNSAPRAPKTPLFSYYWPPMPGPSPQGVPQPAGLRRESGRKLVCGQSAFITTWTQTPRGVDRLHTVTLGGAAGTGRQAQVRGAPRRNSEPPNEAWFGGVFSINRKKCTLK